jgi:hypothetical protein
LANAQFARELGLGDLEASELAQAATNTLPIDRRFCDTLHSLLA